MPFYMPAIHIVYNQNFTKGCSVMISLALPRWQYKAAHFRSQSRIFFKWNLSLQYLSNAGIRKIKHKHILMFN